jgi:predicted lipid-binding transport protein (Tim44 family)
MLKPLQRAWRGRRSPASPAAGVPAGVDVEAFLRLARQSFVRLQAAWDAADLDALARLTTGPLFQDLREQLRGRGAGLNRTDVLTLQAQLLLFEELAGAWFASVEFSGLIRERSEAGAAPFRELWMMARPKSDDGAWQLHGVQSLS